MLSNITLVSLSSDDDTSTFIMTWPSENIQNITKYRVMISSAQYCHTEIDTSMSTAIINLNYSIFCNPSTSQSACGAVKIYSVFALGKHIFYCGD